MVIVFVCLFFCFRNFDFQDRICKEKFRKLFSLFKQETDIIKVVTSTNGSFWAPLSNLYVRSILKVWNNVKSRKKVSYTWWRHFITNIYHIFNNIFVLKLFEFVGLEEPEWKTKYEIKFKLVSLSSPFPLFKEIFKQQMTHIYAAYYKSPYDKFKSR